MPTSPEEKGFGQADPALTRWAASVFAPEDEVLREIRERSVREGLPAIAVGKFDGLHLEVLTRAAGARKAVEIGTLGGYSGVCIVRGLGPGAVPAPDLGRQGRAQDPPAVPAGEPVPSVLGHLGTHRREFEHLVAERFRVGPGERAGAPVAGVGTQFDDGVRGQFRAGPLGVTGLTAP